MVTIILSILYIFQALEELNLSRGMTIIPRNLLRKVQEINQLHTTLNTKQHLPEWKIKVLFKER